MTQRQDTSGPQFRADRPREQEAVRTTIVGGRPPGSGQSLGDVPRGIEVLVKKASVDPAFKNLLLQKRAEAANEIGLRLDTAEVMMLRAVPESQLRTIIARTSVPDEHRRAFLGKVAAAMLVAVGISAPGCDAFILGVRPDEVPKPKPKGPGGKETDPVEPEPEKPAASSEQEKPEPDPGIRGIRPDRVPVTDGVRPDRIPVPEGIRPDRIPAPQGARPDRIPPPTGIRPD